MSCFEKNALKCFFFSLSRWLKECGLKIRDYNSIFNYNTDSKIISEFVLGVNNTKSAPLTFQTFISPRLEEFFWILRVLVFQIKLTCFEKYTKKKRNLSSHKIFFSIVHISEIQNQSFRVIFFSNKKIIAKVSLAMKTMCKRYWRAWKFPSEVFTFTGLVSCSGFSPNPPARGSTICSSSPLLIHTAQTRTGSSRKQLFHAHFLN